MELMLANLALDRFGKYESLQKDFIFKMAARSDMRSNLLSHFVFVPRAFGPKFFH